MAEIYFARTDVSYSGGDKFFSITFSYIKKEHIKVLINDVETENFTFNTESQIVVNDDLVVGDIISIRRTTPIDERMVVFSDTSILNKNTQNLAQEQLLNAIQEVYDNNIQFNIDTVNLIAQNKADTDAAQAEFERDINETLSTVIEAAEKLNILDEAVATATQKAEEVKTNLETAIETMDDKLYDADTAVTNANAAVTNANAAAELATQKAAEAAQKLNETLNKTQVTNSILETPEETIKIELNNGTLTLKAGSVVSIPNGFEDDGTSRHFDYIEITSDMTLASYNGTYRECVCVNPDTGINSANIDKCFASTTPPSFTGVAIWYDLQNNLLKHSTDSGASWTSGFSMPLCLCSVVNNVRSTIDQIFNFIGFIGNHIWASKGIKFLAPNGRNADGSLKNYEYMLTSNINQTLSNLESGIGVFFLCSEDSGATWDVHYRLLSTQWYIQEEQPQVENCEWYNPKTNLWKHCVSGEWSDILICPLGRVSCEENQILSLYNYSTLDLLKRSDRGEIIEWSKPNLTISGSQLKGYNTVYIAEEDGWVQFNTHVQCTANYLAPASYIQVYGIIDEINVFGHMLRCNWDGEGNTVGSATMQTLTTRIYRGQTYKLYTYQATGSASVVSYELRFIPLAKKGA